MSSANSTINTATSTTNATGGTGTTTTLPSVVFTKANYIFILWFLAIYVVAYYFLGFIFKK